MCYHTVKWVYFEGIKLVFVVFALPRTLIILEFAQHMSKSVEHNLTDGRSLDYRPFIAA